MTDSQPQTASEANAAAKRKFERHSCRLKARIRRMHASLGAAEKYTECFIRNQSVGGLLLESPIYFPIGIQLEIGFNSPSAQQSFLGEVTIRWSQRIGGAWFLGVAADRLNRF